MTSSATIYAPLPSPPKAPKMSEYQQKPNTANLFRVPEEKREKDTWPEYDGEFCVECPSCKAVSKGWISGWVRESKAGKKFFSISLKFKRHGNA